MINFYTGRLARRAALTLLFLGVNAVAQGQSSASTGRVTADGKPLQNVAVALTAAGLPSSISPPVALTVTDEDGRYRLERVPAGRYLVTALAPAFVVENKAMYGLGGEAVTVDGQGAAEGVDLKLVRGGVIAGRVTDADGNPYVNGRVRLALVDERNNKLLIPISNRPIFDTDDRGEYRIYGLPPGRYLISAGGEFRSDSSAQTFYPATADEARAELVEVAAGKEATGIDIKVVRPPQTYTAAGSVVDDRTGSPLAELAYKYSAVDSAGRAGRPNVGRTNAKGEFKIAGLAPGRYTASVTPDGSSNLYSKPLAFEVRDGDVSNLQIRAQRTATIRGTVLVENSSDAAVLRKLPQLKLMAQARDVRGMNPPPAAVGERGDFRIDGLPAGKTRLSLSTLNAPAGFSVLRIERDGVEQGDTIDAAAGEEISGVRVVLSYGTGAVRGQVKLPEGMQAGAVRFMAYIRRADAGPTGGGKSAEVDAAGRFAFEGLATGTYTVTLLPLPVPGRSPTPAPKATPQNISVSDANVTEVVMTLEAQAP